MEVRNEKKTHLPDLEVRERIKTAFSSVVSSFTSWIFFSFETIKSISFKLKCALALNSKNEEPTVSFPSKESASPYPFHAFIRSLQRSIRR